jgi:hypothetical protein
VDPVPDPLLLITSLMRGRVCLLYYMLLFLWNFAIQLKSIYYSFLQLTTACKRPLFSHTNLRRESTENRSRGLYPLLCDVSIYAEVCLPSRCVETGCKTAMFYCYVIIVHGVYGAVAWQCIQNVTIKFIFQ